MKKSLTLGVPNSVVFITGSSKRDLPTIERNSVVWSTPSCAAVGCIPDVDGETRFTIGLGNEVRIGKMPAFDGQVGTKARVVRVEIVPRKVILEHAVPNFSTRGSITQ